MKQRIGFIDTLKGFTIFIVVYSHVLLCTFEGKAPWSINDIFSILMMPLFFFISGFLMYKAHQFTEIKHIGLFLRKKGFFLLVPTLIFSLLYALILRKPYASLLIDKAKCGYWFTFTLFFFFLIYSIGDYLIGKWAKGEIKLLVGVICTCFIYAFAKLSLVPSCPWFNMPFNGIMGFANYQHFLFFFFGALIRANFSKVTYILEIDIFRFIIVIGCLVSLLLLLLPDSRLWIISTFSFAVYSLLRSLSALFCIALAFVYFYQNEGRITQSRCFQILSHIGTRTMDIYLIHLILVHTNMRFIGNFLETNGSYISEFVICGTVSAIIIGLCLLISRFLRCSNTLARFLFGKVIKEQ